MIFLRCKDKLFMLQPLGCIKIWRLWINEYVLCDFCTFNNNQRAYFELLKSILRFKKID